MTRYLIAAFLLPLLILACGKKTQPPVENQLIEMNYSTYEEAWKKIDSLEQQQLYQSAQKLVEELAEKAKAEKNAPQIVKTTVYRCKYLQYLTDEGNAPVMALELFRREMEQAPFPARPLMQSMLAERYAGYLRDNRWQLQNRTDMAEVSEDPATWPGEEFERRSKALYLQSVSDERIRQVPIETFDALTLPGKYNKGLRPTLYDFLAHRALDHFANEQSYLNRPSYAFYIEDPRAFAPAEEFVQWEINTRDTVSYKYRALVLFQELLRFRMAGQEIAHGADALLDADRKRLKFVYENGSQADKDRLYTEALQKLRTTFGESPLKTDILAELASWYYDKGQKYTAGMADETYRYHWKKALEICEEGLRLPKDPDELSEPGRARCADLKNSLLRSSLLMTTERIYVPQKPALAQLMFRNIKHAWLKILPYDEKIEEKLQDVRHKEGREGAIAYLNSLDPVWKQSVELPPQDDLHMHSLEVALPARAAGQYLLMASDDETFASGAESGYTILTYSQLGIWQRNLPSGKSEFFVFDREQGSPLEGITAEAWVSEYRSMQRRSVWRKAATTASDKDGHFAFDLKKGERNFRLKLIGRGEELFMPDNFHSYNYGRSSRARKRTHFFLDRAIYRPGQTVFFKAVLLSFDENEKPEILPRQEVSITLLDANYQEVKTLKLVSNEYGTVSGTFQAPSSGLLGNMYLRSSVGGRRFAFRVEEYKRPKFFVKAEPVKGSFRLGEELVVPGKAEAYAGYPLDGATVSYRVVREVSFPWLPRWYWRWRINPWAGESAEIARGELKTGVDGTFEIPFRALPDKSIPQDKKPEFAYTVYIDVTDITGETHSLQTSVRVGYVALSISADLPEQMESKDLRELKIKSANLQGEFEPAKGKVVLELLKAPARPLIRRYWEEPDLWPMSREEFLKKFPQYAYRDEGTPSKWEVQRELFSASFDTEKSQELFLPKVLFPAGVYRLRITTQDKFGTPVQREQYLKLYNTDKGLLPQPSIAWTLGPQRPCEPGEKASWYVGTSLDKLPVLLEFERDGKLLSREWTTVQGLRNFRRKIEEADRGNLQYMLHYAALNRTYHDYQTLIVPWTNKKLKVEYRSFRDKLLPGQDESWEIAISGPKGEKVAAEMVATMYDASLDAFVPKPWDFRVWPERTYVQNTLSSPGYSRLNMRNLSSRHTGSYVRVNRTYRQLNWFKWHSYGRTLALYERDAYSVSAAVLRKEGHVAEAAPPEDMQVADSAGLEAAPPSPPSAAGEKPQAPEQEAPAPQTPAVRENLDETVFFMPDLRTDADGRIILSFKMNEALTRWKFQLFAHTPDLKYALDTRELVTQKDLMIVPHPPRFLREGDEIEFTAKVVNLSEQTLSGNAVLQMVNPLNSVPVYKWLDNPDFNRHFTVEAGRSAAVAWRFKVPPVNEVPLIEYTVEAGAGDYTDAERSLLPVLTDRMLVTESMPLPVRGGEHKTFAFERMQNHGSSTLANNGLTLEFTSNPAWYAVQALPYLMEYPYECSEQIFSRYYANSLATTVANSQPRIREIFEAWSEEDLQSPLYGNQELKSALLEETPWVLDAQSEEKQRKNIALLFDLHRMAKERARAIDKLAQRQLANGGFAWFAGGRDNWYITQYIVEGLAHLDRLGALQTEDEPRLRNMIKRAVSYIDDRMLEYYHDLERSVKKGYTSRDDDHLSPIIIHYLYTRSFFLDRDARAGLGLVGGPDGYMALPKKVEKAFNYFMDQAEKHWTKKSVYQQGMLALCVHRTEAPGAADIIMRSLKERAIRHPELGMYWKTPRGYFWYQHPIEQQALLIEAFSEVANDAESVDAMKAWLLKHKQTNAWRTTKATAEAVYALLSFGDNWLAESEPVHITLGGKDKADAWYNKRITEARQTAMPGTGHFKLHFSAEDMVQDMAVVEVENPNKHVAWGALYWQYFEKLEKITTFEETPLQLRRALFKVVLDDTGERLVSLSANGSTLEVGDKVRVRVELRVDRDMEYVHMRDMRASGFEPVEVLSRYKWQGGLGYYQSTRDASTDFFFSYLPKGTYVFEYTLRVAHRGEFSNGITSIQCMYAPEFTSHAEGLHVSVK